MSDPAARPRLVVRRLSTALATMGALAACGGGNSGGPTATPGTGSLRVQLTDAVFPYDSVARVDVFVVRADAKIEEADSAEAAARVGDDDKGADGWVTIAEPRASIELTALRNGVTTTLGAATLPANSYRGFRLVIDPAQSSVTLRNGTVLTATSSPGVKFPNAGRNGIRIQLDRPVVVPAAADGAAPPTLLIDFDLNASFEVKGNSLSKDGLVFRPGIKATSR